jgi:cell pole-organizing protein PopZ
MTIINGANNHNVEDILSSIRNSMGEESVFARAATVKPFARRDGSAHEDNAEFELPAIFKPGHHGTTEKPSNLFGRLGDALKPAAPENERPRTVIRFEPAAARMIEPPPAMAAAQAPQRPLVSPPASPTIADDPNIKREMPSFFDTRLNKLGEMTRKANAPKPVELHTQAPQVQALQALVPQPPPLRPIPQAEAGSDMEDAAAQLLRPILKQWLMENMPKIVEKALRSETHEEAPPQEVTPAGRKPGQ